MEHLGPNGVAAVVDLLDAVELGSTGIQVVVTDRPQAVRAEVERRCPAGWIVGPVFTPQRDRFLAGSVGSSGQVGRLLIDVIDPRHERESLRALNDQRERFLAKRTCLILVVAGTDGRDADAAYMELQARAPDFWSVRSRVLRITGSDPELGRIDALLDLLTPRFGGDRAAARCWLDGRPLAEEWVEHRLWRDGGLRTAWLASSSSSVPARAAVGGRAVEPSQGDGSQPRLDLSPQGAEISLEHWSLPSLRAGILDAEQQELVRELAAAFERDGTAELWVLPGHDESETMVNSLHAWSVLESRYAPVLWLDARDGLEGTIARCLRDAGDVMPVAGLLGAAQRLEGALGGAPALLLVTDVKSTELQLLRAAVRGRAIMAVARAEPYAAFCVVGSEAHLGHARWAHGELSRWSGGATQQRVRWRTALLDLREALSRARFVVVLLDDESDDWPREAWRLLERASERVAVFTLGRESMPDAGEGLSWHGELGSDESSAGARLRGLAHEVAGDPVPYAADLRGVPWPSPQVHASILGSSLEDAERSWRSWLADGEHEVSDALVAGMEQAATALSLVGRVSREFLPGLVERVTPHLSASHREVIVECMTEHYRASDGGTVDPPEPDMLGDALVWRVLQRDDRRAGGVARWLELSLQDSMPHGAVTRMLTVLTRVALQDGGQPWLEQLLRTHGVELVQRVERTANAGAPDPPGALLEAAVRLLKDGDVAERIGQAVPQATVALREVEATAFGIALRVERKKVPADRSRLAKLLLRVGRCHSNLGRREDALRATQEAVDVIRKQAKDRPGVFLPRLANALNNLGAGLSDLGRQEEALRVTQEAVDVVREQAKDRPEAFLPELAGALNNLGMMLGNLGRREDALRIAQEAVENYRKLVTRQPEAYLPAFALALNNLGAGLGNLGRREDALRVTQEAVENYRKLAKDRPDAFLPELAHALNNLGIWLSNLGRREGGLRVTQEAVESYRKLAMNQPDAFLPELANALNNLGIRLSESGKRENALRIAQEAVESYRQLAKDQPEAFLPDLARSLNNLGVILSELGRREDALRITQEAVDVRRELAKDRPEVFLPDLGSALNNLGMILSELGRREDALRVMQESVKSYRDVAKGRPDALLPDFARALKNLGGAHHSLKSYQHALDSFAEALRLMLPAFEQHPKVFDELVSSMVKGLNRASSEGGLPIPQDLVAVLKEVEQSG